VFNISLARIGLTAAHPQGTDFVIGGSSAGGLATYMHLDHWASRLPITAKVWVFLRPTIRSHLPKTNISHTWPAGCRTARQRLLLGIRGPEAVPHGSAVGPRGHGVKVQPRLHQQPQPFARVEGIALPDKLLKAPAFLRETLVNQLLDVSG
jgi:hypothetical protein